MHYILTSQMTWVDLRFQMLLCLLAETNANCVRSVKPYVTQTYQVADHNLSLRYSGTVKISSGSLGWACSSS